MGIPQILLALAILGVSLAGIEGINVLTGGEVYLASVQQLAQETQQSLPQPTTEVQPQQPQPPPPPPPERPRVGPPPGEQPTKPGHPGDKGQPPMVDEGEEHEGFFDPREIQQILREIKQLRADIKRISNQLRKIAGSEGDIAALTEISSQLTQHQTAISNPSASNSELREAAQDFRDSNFWEQINKYRAKAELPKQIKEISNQLKRLERTIKVKAVQNLGLNLGQVQQSLAEIRQNLQVVQDNFNSGNYEEAMEAMQYFHEGGWPGEIEGTIHRVREIKRMLNQVKDRAIRAEVEKTLQEVIDAFNEGNYRDARETLDEYADDIQRLISQFLRASRGKINRQESLNKIRSLEDLIKSKLQDVEERRENRSNNQQIPVQSVPRQPVAPTQ